MEGRTFGSSALAALDSDRTRLSPQCVALVRAGLASANPAAGDGRTAALAYVPPDPAGHARGALFALAEEEPAAGRDGSSAAPALQHLAETFYGSLARTAGNALESAVGAGLEHLRALARGGRPVAGVGLAAVAVQEGQLWLATAGACAAYVLRVPGGEWQSLAAPPRPAGLAPFAPRPDVHVRPGDAIRLQPGDLVLLASAGLRARIPESVLKSSIPALLRSDPTITEQDLAEILVRMADGRSGPGESAAVVVRCNAVLPRAEALALGWPATHRLARTLPLGGAWNIVGLERLAAEGPDAAPAPSPAPPPAAAEPLPVTVAQPPPGPPLPAPPAPPIAWGTHAAAAAHSVRATLGSLGPAGWAIAAPRLAQLLLPAVGLFLGGGLMAAVATGNLVFFVGGTSLSLVMVATAVLPNASFVARLTVSGGAAQLGRGSRAPVPAPRARPYRPPAQPGRATLRSNAEGSIRWTKDRLILPPAEAVKAGCLDLINLKDPAGRISAQVVLLCPERLLGVGGGAPGGLYVMLHDLATGQRSVVAWLAPGERRVEAARQDVAEYGGHAAAALRWLRGPGDFELTSSRLRVSLRVEQCRFAEPVRKQQLDALEIVLTGVQGLP